MILGVPYILYVLYRDYKIKLSPVGGIYIHTYIYLPYKMDRNYSRPETSEDRPLVFPPPIYCCNEIDKLNSVQGGRN